MNNAIPIPPITFSNPTPKALIAPNNNTGISITAARTNLKLLSMPSLNILMRLPIVSLINSKSPVNKPLSNKTGAIIVALTVSKRLFKVC